MSYYEGKATIYARDTLGFGYNRYEILNVRFGDAPASVIFSKKRSQKAYSLDNVAVILTGWGHPELENYVTVSRREDCVVTESRYLNSDIRWEKDFDTFIAEYLPGIECTILADYRGYISTESSARNNDVIVDPFSDYNDPIDLDKIFDSPIILEDGSVRGGVLVEGGKSESLLSVYERSPEARRKCIEAYGMNCIICGFNFRDVYGEPGNNLIHVHHLTPLSLIGQEHEVNPVRDLRPVCANCHAVIHRRDMPVSIDEVKSMVLTNDLNLK